jgi:hypothetical protein
MSLYLVKQQPVVIGGLAASFSDFARSKRLADGLKDTIQILNSYSVAVGNPPLDGLAGELFGRPVDAKLLAGFDIAWANLCYSSASKLEPKYFGGN